MRRFLGLSLYALGGAMMAFAVGRYAVGEWDQHEARRAWEAHEAQAVVALARRAALGVDRSVRGVELSLGVPVARIRIPRLALDEIVLEGVDDNSLNGGPGHLPGSAFPGETGNSIISAHRDRHFARLGELRVGDTVHTEAGSISEQWVVISKRVVDADAPALFNTRDATLTLTTCWPIRYFGTAPERLIVTAKPVARMRQAAISSFPTGRST